MIRVTSFQPADLVFVGPNRRDPAKGSVLLRTGVNEYDDLPPHILARFQIDEQDGLCSIEHIIDQVVA